MVLWPFEAPAGDLAARSWRFSTPDAYIDPVGDGVFEALRPHGTPRAGSYGVLGVTLGLEPPFGMRRTRAQRGIHPPRGADAEQIRRVGHRYLRVYTHVRMASHFSAEYQG